MAIEPAKIKNLGREPDMASIKQKLEEMRMLLNQLNDSVSLLQTTATPGGTTGYVQFNDDGAFTAADTLFWDKVNKRLGVNTINPAYSIQASKTSANAIIGVVRTDGCDCYTGAGANNMIFVNNTAGKGFSFTSYGNLRIMLMTSAGDVIVGPTGSPSFKLDVQGTCGISDLKTPAGSHPTNYKSVYVNTDTGKLYSM